MRSLLRITLILVRELVHRICSASVANCQATPPSKYAMKDSNIARCFSSPGCKMCANFLERKQFQLRSNLERIQMMEVSYWLTKNSGVVEQK